MHHTAAQLYIASTLSNSDQVRRLRDRFRQDHQIELTYDWSKHGQVSDPVQMQQLAELELRGVRQARCLLLVFPAALGSHFEAGAAAALGIPIVILCADSTQLRTSFHHLPGLRHCRTEDEAVTATLAVLRPAGYLAPLGPPAAASLQGDQ